MSQRFSNGVKIAALDHKLRSSDLAECAEIVPSPDLSQLAFVRDLDDLAQAGLWVTPTGDQAPVPLVASQAITRLAGSGVGAVIARPRWSADGRWIAFASYEGLPPGKEHTLWVVKAEAGSLPELLYRGSGIIAAHLWSSDGACLAVADSDAGLVIARLDGTSEVVDAAAMRYPLEENSMAWLDGGRRLLYMNLAAGEAGLWMLQMPDGQKQQVVELSQDEVMIPAGVNGKEKVAWGALQGNVRQQERGVILHFWPGDGGKMKAMPLPNIEFDPASSLLPNDDGSLWAFTVWKKGQRVPFVVARPAHQGHVLAVPGVVTRVLGWSDAPRRLWVLLHPPRLVGLDIDLPAEPVVPADESFSLDLTPAELVYLLETLGGHSMIGLATPCAEMAADEAEGLREEAKAALTSKGYVVVLPGDQIQMDLTVAALVQCCASPQQTWTTTFETAMGERDVRHIHQAQNLIVEDAILASGSHRLTPVRDNTTFLQRIEQQMHLRKQPAATGEPFVLPEEILFRIREIAAAGGEKAAAQYLVGAGVAEATAAQFAHTLAQPVSNSSVSRWSVVGEEVATSLEEGIGILEGAAGLWLLHPFEVEGAVRVKVSPADATTVLRQIAGLLAQKATPSSA